MRAPSFTPPVSVSAATCKAHTAGPLRVRFAVTSLPCHNYYVSLLLDIQTQSNCRRKHSYGVLKSVRLVKVGFLLFDVPNQSVDEKKMAPGFDWEIVRGQESRCRESS